MNPKTPMPRANLRRSERLCGRRFARVRGLSAAVALGAAAIAALPACVTVNVNFPESAVQKATDDYVRELYRAKSQGREADKPAPTSALESRLGATLAAVGDALVPSARAEAGFQVKTGKTAAIQGRMAGRVSEVLKYKRQGVIGETSDGLLTLREAGALKPIERKKVESLVAADNADREELYAEVMAANGVGDDRRASLRASFARSFQAESPSRTWVQDASGQWAQKP
jgi:uncharacterized protein YdbL (DUF1318 family)